MKLAIRRRAALNLKNKIEELANQYIAITAKLPKDLIEVLLHDKKWAEINAAFIVASPQDKVKILVILNEYEKEKARTNPHFKELLEFKINFKDSFHKDLPELIPLINGESKYKFIRELERLLFGEPSTKKNKFFGLLFVLLATGGVFGTTIGILASEPLRDSFGNNGFFAIDFLRDLANGHHRFLNIASWYVAFEILGFKGRNLLRRDDVFQIPKTPESKKGSVEKSNTYMIDQNLNNMMTNIKQIMEYSKDPKFGSLMMNDHPWAVDHLTVATENIDQVTEFLQVKFNKK